MSKRTRMSRRDLLKLGAATGAAAMFERAWAAQCGDVPVPIEQVALTGCQIDADLFPVSPFILNPFSDPLPIPKAMAPGYRRDDGTLAPPGATDAWTVRIKDGFNLNTPTSCAPGPGVGEQDAIGDRPANDPFSLGLPRAGTHQLWPGGPAPTLAGNSTALAAFKALPQPLLYHIRLQVNAHAFTTSDVQPIGVGGVPVSLPPGANALPGKRRGTFKLPPATIYGFNGTFPGPMINCEYGQPTLVRFENDLDVNPFCLDRQDFGAPDWAFLTHQHNGHTAPESDGNPNHMTVHDGGYQPGEWVDNLYLGYPAGGLDSEKQSSLWFHDHRMHHTGPNVYKGMVGLMPHYDPELDFGDERFGLRLPGVRTNNLDGSFDVKYDIPMALYDVCLDDGVTEHRDAHTPQPVCGLMHPEWWGKHFLKHYPNHGFVGDIFTVNGTAYPVLNVERRRYRFRFLGASLSRCYDLSLRTGTPQPAPGQQGQWRFGARRGTFDRGQLAMRMMQIASEGGLLPNAIERDSLEIWPAKRREIVVDFSRYLDGTPTKKGDVVYLTNTLKMPNGRKPLRSGEEGFDPDYAVPLLKIVIGDLPKTRDNSLMPVAGTPLRPAPFVDSSKASPNVLADRTFTLQRGGTAGGETEWLINGLEFNPIAPLALPKINTFETWSIDNGGGGWTHPMHIHMEEHHVIFRSSALAHPDDTGKEDVVALEGSERTKIFRGFRTFVGNYVAHCHNLAHEDHNMMFGWTIAP